MGFSVGLLPACYRTFLVLLRNVLVLLRNVLGLLRNVLGRLLDCFRAVNAQLSDCFRACNFYLSAHLILKLIKMERYRASCCRAASR